MPCNHSNNGSAKLKLELALAAGRALRLSTIRSAWRRLPSLRLRDLDTGAEVPYPLRLARIDGKLQIVR